MEEGLVKVALPVGRVDAWERETVWAAPLGDDLFEIRNVAWLADGVHNKDVVRCRRTEDGGLDFVEVVRASGHDTLHVVFTTAATDSVREKTLAALEERLGHLERAAADAWAVDVNPGTDLAWALEYLGRLQAQGYLEGRPDTEE